MFLITDTEKKYKELFLAQNATVRVLTNSKKVEHITPVLKSLHWPSVCQRIDLRVLVLVYKTLNGLGPKYISDLLFIL